MKRSVSIILLLVAVVSFWICGALHAPLRKARGGTVAAVDDAPPAVAFTAVALGGFRGLIADLLWVRASELQDQGKYLEIVQLAEWITRLEPRYPEVWAFHAWNMAYNVSVMLPDPADRWRWVRNGIRLLRDEGIAYNAEDPRLYWELGWLYLNKVGGRWDEAGLFYKVRLAEEMTELLGGGFPDLDRLGRDPAARERLEREHGLRLGVMHEIDREYGPLDWRLPESHAVYWAYRGRQLQPSDPWCSRVVYQGMMETFREGYLVFDPHRNLYLRAPRLELVAQVSKVYQRALAVGKDVIVETAYANFLRAAVVSLFAFDRTREAADLYHALRSRLPPDETGSDVKSFVRQELRERMANLDAGAAEKLTEDMLSRSYCWRALDRPDVAAGFEVLARLSWQEWETSQAEQRPEEVARGAWSHVRSNAFERALTKLPEPLQEKLREQTKE